MYPPDIHSPPPLLCLRLRWLFLLLALASVPYLIAVNLSVFTDYVHRYSHEFGVKVYDPTEISSFTVSMTASGNSLSLYRYLTVQSLLAETLPSAAEK